MCNCFPSFSSFSGWKRKLDDFFPLCNINYRYGTLSISGNYWGNWEYFDGNRKKIPHSFFTVREGMNASKSEYATKKIGEVEVNWKEGEKGKVYESLINEVFLATNGELDYFEVYFQEGDEYHKGMEIVRVDRIKEILDGRPLKTKLFYQISFNIFLNSDIYFYWRDYVDFDMYYAQTSKFEEDKLELTNKLLKCEFLLLDCVLSNPEALESFSGWGLFVGHATLNNISFGLIYDTIMSWYSGKSIRRKFLCLQGACIQEDLWSKLVLMSKEIKHPDSRLQCRNEFEITRSDGERCIFAQPGSDRVHVYFGERRKEENLVIFGNGLSSR